MNKSGVEMQEMINRYNLGNVRGDPGWLWDPDILWAARGLDMSHVKDMKVSFVQTATINTNMLVVIIHDILCQRLEQQKLLGQGPDGPTRSREELLQVLGCTAMNIRVTFKLYTAGGNHSRVGLLELGSEFPLNRSYKDVRFQLCVMPTGPKTTRVLTMYGNIDNMKLNLAPNFSSIVRGIRLRMYATSVEGPTAAERKEMEEDLSWCLRMQPGQIGLHFALASRTPAVWALVDKLMKGEFTHVGDMHNKPANSCGNFYMLGGNLPEEVTLKLLDSVLNNTLSWTGLRGEVAKYKIKDRIRREIVDYLGVAGLIKPLKKTKSGLVVSARPARPYPYIHSHPTIDRSHLTLNIPPSHRPPSSKTSSTCTSTRSS